MCLLWLFQDDWGSSDSSVRSKAHMSDDKTHGLETLPPGRKLHFPSCTATQRCFYNEALQTQTIVGTRCIHFLSPQRGHHLLPRLVEKWCEHRVDGWKQIDLFLRHVFIFFLLATVDIYTATGMTKNTYLKSLPTCVAKPGERVCCWDGERLNQRSFFSDMGPIFTLVTVESIDWGPAASLQKGRGQWWNPHGSYRTPNTTTLTTWWRECVFYSVKHCNAIQYYSI